MTLDEFLSLPDALRWKVFADVSPKLEAAISQIEAPRLPRSPKFDQKLPRKGGYVWASELALDNLQWYLQMFKEGAEKPDNQYAEKDAKRAEKLGYWVEWRLVEPSKQWRGERGFGDDAEVVTAEAPSHQPQRHDWDNRSNGNRGPVEHGGPEDFGGSDYTDDPIPF